MDIAIVKYNAGNIQSVLYALERIGLEAVVTDDHAALRSADKVIFPGVGEASTAMDYLKERGLDRLIRDLRQPVLGICLGMQLMCKYSEENDTKCLGIFGESVKKFRPAAAASGAAPEGGGPAGSRDERRESVGSGSALEGGEPAGLPGGEGQTGSRNGKGDAGRREGRSVLKVPQIGWNTIYDLKTPLFEGLAENSYCYFVHGYYAALGQHTIATTDYTLPYSSGLHRDNFYGVQFHPEKSAQAGERILRNFLEGCV